jgi:hypothetical protein
VFETTRAGKGERSTAVAAAFAVTSVSACGSNCEMNIVRLVPSRLFMPHVTRHTSHVTRHTSHVTRHTSHVTRHTSHVTRHTSHVTRHSSHVTRHTSHVKRHQANLHNTPAPLHTLHCLQRRSLKDTHTLYVQLLLLLLQPMLLTATMLQESLPLACWRILWLLGDPDENVTIICSENVA